ncbi:MAG: ATP-binding cassette domain-containing protein [Planctomycetota bacterium]
MLELKGVSKSYGPTRALEPTDLTVPEGQTLVLIGPSGCGKSTLLRLMIGLIRPDPGSASDLNRGTVHFRGTELVPSNAHQIRHHMGYVIQEGGLFPHLSAQGNITIMARYLRWEDKKIAARLAELLELTRFPNSALQRYPVQLSGGQRQRVSLMRALMLDPDVLLLDEPLGSLDPLIRAELQQDLRRIFRSLGKTVVLVTHDLSEASFFGDEIVLLDGGRIVQRGPLQALLESPADPFVTRFVRAQRTLHGESPS